MSTIKVDTIQTTGGTEVYTAKAWVNFNGTGAVAVRDSGNVSSITDNGTGDYTVNFSTSLSSANYSYSHAYSNEVSVYHTVGFFVAISSLTLNVRHYDVTNSANVIDKGYVFLAMFE